MELSPQVATAAAMLAHELATNALKYGSLSHPSGRIEISWDMGLQIPGRQLSFAWIERGGPKVSRPVNRGFGTRLIQRGFATDKQSSVDLRFEEAGFECHIVTRLPEAE